jgi:hypothetical protein
MHDTLLLSIEKRSHNVAGRKRKYKKRRTDWRRQELFYSDFMRTL